jgi:hypothetical protein
MGRIELLQPLLEGGIRNTNFFNGRLLSAEDLRQEQQANRERDAQLARAVGAGVVYGLQVERAEQKSGGGLTNAVVKVSEGLALNDNGQSLALPANTEVALVRALEIVNAEAGLFATCEPPTQTAAVVAGAGIYLLVITPASGYEQRAPASGLGNVGLTSPGCGSRYAVEGVQFKLVNVNTDTLAGIPPATRTELNNLMSQNTTASKSLLRNVLAHLFLASAEVDAFIADPFKAEFSLTPNSKYGALDALKTQGDLTACDVPLALIYWTADGIQFVDMWSARRRPTRRAVFERWSPLLDDRRASEGEATFQQFQNQIEYLLATETSPHLIRAKDYFRYLPPVGIIPITLTGSSDAFDFAEFFTGVTFHDAVYTDGARVAGLLREACHYPPVDLHNPVDVESTELFWLYNVRQNTQAQAAGAASVKSYLIFSSGQMPFVGEAQFDVSRWSYSNFI